MRTAPCGPPTGGIQERKDESGTPPIPQAAAIRAMAAITLPLSHDSIVSLDYRRRGKVSGAVRWRIWQLASYKWTRLQTKHLAELRRPSACFRNRLPTSGCATWPGK